LNDRWDYEAATGLLRAALAEIESLNDELSPARAEVLLNQFERDVGSAHIRQDLFAVKITCERYQHKFRTLAKKTKHHRYRADRRIASSPRRARRVIHIGQHKAKGRDVNGALWDDQVQIFAANRDYNQRRFGTSADTAAQVVEWFAAVRETPGSRRVVLLRKPAAGKADLNQRLEGMKQKYDGKDLQGLADLGHEQGYLTFDQVNEFLPQNVASVTRKNSTTVMQRGPRGCTRGEVRSGRSVLQLGLIARSDASDVANARGN
jgi:hypothetical protein